MSYGAVVTTTARDFLDEGDDFSGLGRHQMISRSGMGGGGQGVVVDTRLGGYDKLWLQLQWSLVRVDS